MHFMSKNQDRTACIFCNGELRAPDEARLLASTAKLLIAADGGARHLAAMDMKPNAIIGDMASLIEDPWRNDPGIQRIVYPVDKNRSDTELALDWAFKQGADKALLLGALGRRIGHVLGHCAPLIRYPGRVALCDDGLFVQAIDAGQGVDIHVSVNDLISLFPVSGCPHVKTTGLRYTLNDETLEFATHGLNNLALQDECSIEVNRGLILLCVEKPNR